MQIRSKALSTSSCVPAPHGQGSGDPLVPQPFYNCFPGCSCLDHCRGSYSITASPSFTLGKEQYGQTKSASALLSLTFQPKCRVGAMLCYTRFPPTLLLQAGVKSFFWWQSFCSWAHSFPSLAHQEVPPGSWLLRVKISSIPFPFNHPSWLMQYQKFICTFIIAKNIGILPCLATICCICFLFSSNWEFGSHLTITGSKGLFKYEEVLRKITAWIFSSKIAI